MNGVERVTQDFSQISLSVDRTDVPRLLAESAQGIIKKQGDIFDRAMESKVWSDDHIALKDVPRFRKRFAGASGSIVLPQILNGSPYQEFYTDGRMYKRALGNAEPEIQHRGARYFAAIDKNLNPEEKAKVFHVDIQDGLRVIERTAESGAREHMEQDDLLLQLGVLDYIKNGFLTAFHALTYPERKGTIPMDEAYQENKDILFKYARLFTRRFFETAVGRDYSDELEFATIAQEARQAFAYLSKQGLKQEYFKLPEIDHPLILMANAHENARNHPHVDRIIGLPSGGTLPTLFSEIAYNHLNEREVQVDLVPYSVHSSEKVNGSAMTTQSLEDIVAQLGIGPEEEILLIDDNTQRGKSLDDVRKAILAVAPHAKVHISICEADLRTAQSRQQREDPPEIIANFNHPDIQQSAISIFPARMKPALINKELIWKSRKREALHVLNNYYYGNQTDYDLVG